MKLGVLLLNLGGPTTLSEVKPFLYNLFSDADILPVPFSTYLQKPFAKFVAWRRHKLSKGYYEAIGGGSPIQKITQAQATLLERALKADAFVVKVYVAMRYWYPSTDMAWSQMIADEITDLVVLPLYPQYSLTTTQSSFNALKRVMDGSAYTVKKVHWINHWYDHSAYLEVMGMLIRETIEKLPSEFQNTYDLLYSAHSLPLSVVQKGDPYEKHIHETMRLLLPHLPITVSGHEYLSYQSKAGPLPWLEPSTFKMLKTLSHRKRALIMVPISFVSDHVETLYEMDILYRKEAEKYGIPYFSRVPALNTHPLFMNALASLVKQTIEGKI